MKLRIGTFNIAFYQQQLVSDQRALIESLDLDLVGLQEVDRNSNRNPYNMMEAFENEKYPHSYYVNACHDDGGEFGNGILSKYEFLIKNNISI